MKIFNKIIGDSGEDLATNYLKKHKYKILCRNFTCNIGEIDIIGKNDDSICFIEVKTRQSDYYGYPSEAVNFYKEKKIIKTAQYYICKNKLFNYSIRFDVVEVLLNDYKPEINLIKNAFWVNGYI